MNGSTTATFGVVLPARDEEDYILATLESLTTQQSLDGRPLDPDSYQIIVVENASVDATAERVETFARDCRVPVTLLHDEEASMVSPRIRGMNHVILSAHPTDYLVSADADTTFPPTWLATVASTFTRGADIVSSAGYMSSEIWELCPRLVERYLEHLGPIFFDPDTVRRADVEHGSYPFTEQVFIDFGRPVSDAGFAISTSCYLELGGFRQDYWDQAESMPLPAVGWPLMYRAELAAYEIAYMRTPYWSTSPRRLVNEPEQLFSTSAYLGEIASFRETTTDQYAWLDRFADRIDLRPLQDYCLKYYLLQRCITRPQLLRRNRRYFGRLGDDIARTIFEWHARTPDPTPGLVLGFASDLSREFGDRLLDQLPRAAPPRDVPANDGSVRRPGRRESRLW
jgi:glycosyltransferase involved in cell wall biosynthesis